MLIALPAALAKAPDARGQFDLTAMTELEGELCKSIEEQGAIISAAVPSQEKCEASVKEAQERLVAARSNQRDAARAFDIASEEQTACEASAAEAQKALRDISQMAKKLEREVNNAEVEVEVFEQGPRETFKELCQRSTPPPVVEEEEVVASAAVADEQCMQTMETEVPVPVAAC